MHGWTNMEGGNKLSLFSAHPELTSTLGTAAEALT